MQEISEDVSSNFLTASDLFLRRGNNCKNKSKEDDDFELHKGPKLYYPNESAVAEERIEDIMQDAKNDLELQRTAKNRDCMKAEWNEELKVVIVPYLKGKTTQHMGITLNGKCALSPEEAIFLLEKGYIEIVHNKVSLSVEEAYALMLKGKLSIEKYEVYSFLSQQGFIVVNHHSRTSPDSEKILNLSNTNKRKATDDSVDLPEQKRLTFTGVLASNAVSSQSSSLMSDSVLSNSESFSKVQSIPENTLNKQKSASNVLQETNSKLNSEESEDATISPDSTYHIELNDSTQKEASASSFKAQDDNNVEIKQNDFVCSKDSIDEISDTVNKKISNEQKSKDDSNCEIVENVNYKNGEVVVENANDINGEVVAENTNDKNGEVTVENANDKIDEMVEENTKDKNNEMVVEHATNDNEIDVEHVHDENEIDVEAVHEDNEIDVVLTHDDNEIDVVLTHDDNEIDVVLTHDDNEIDVINANDGNEIHVEFANNGDSNEIIIEDVERVNERGDIEDSLRNYDNECLSSDGSIPVVCEESDEMSVDVFSYSCGGKQRMPNSKTKDLQNRSLNEHDDEVTLVEVRKKEKKPLAVIDLLSDEDDSCVGQSRKDSNSDEEHEDRTNGEEMYEDSDDDIQVLDVVGPVSTSIAQGTSRTTNSVKIESKKFKIPEDSSNAKPPYVPLMKFPDAFRKDIICVPRPPNHLLPLHVQPAKEAYVLSTRKSTQAKQGRVWNSYRDMQDYQRERRLGRHTNSFNTRSGPFRDRNDSYGNQLPSFSAPENPRDDGFNRNIQSYSFQQNRNLSISKPFMNHERSNSLLPLPNAYSNPQNHLPFNMNMNINNLQNLSSSNPVAFVNELQKTVYSLTTSMISSLFGQHLNPNTPSPAHSPAFGEPSIMGFPSHSNNSFAPSPGIPSPIVYNSSGRCDSYNSASRCDSYNSSVRSDFPLRFPQEPAFSGSRYPYPMNSPYTPENNWRQQNYFRQRNFAQRGPSFPCKYRTVRRKRDWQDVKAAVEGTGDSGSDIEEVPINLNQFLWGNDIQPLVKPGTKLSVAEVLKSLHITQMANLCDTKRCNERYLPTTPSLEISFDVYLPNSKYKRSEPTTPKCRIIVVRSSDPIPRYSELVYLQRKLDDKALLQLAVVDHSDISFYSFSSLNVPEIVPFES